MKKLLLFIIVLALSSFKISIEPREAIAQDKILQYSNTSVVTETKHMDGMTYRIFMAKETHGHQLDISVVNVTKEKLEVEKLKLEIIRLKRENRNSGY